MSNYKTEATVKLDDAQIYFLRTRYGKRKDISADKLVRLAVIEVVAMQAQKELDENGYDVGLVTTDQAIEANRQLAEGTGQGEG